MNTNKWDNLIKILECLYKKPWLTRKEITVKTGISKQTLSNNIRKHKNLFYSHSPNFSEVILNISDDGMKMLGCLKELRKLEKKCRRNYEEWLKYDKETN